MIELYINWSPDPAIFTIFGHEVRWYGLLFALAFVAGYQVITWIFKIEKVPIKQLDQLATYVIIGTIAGARLGHCLFYEPSYYLAHPLKILFIWEGGLASHGAAIGVLISLWLFSRKYNWPFLKIVDRVVVSSALGGAFIRLGNLMNSEIIGEPTEKPWGFIFSSAYYPGDLSLPRHPAQLYEAIAYFIIFLILILIYNQYRIKTPHGLLLGWFMVLVFGVRIFVETIKENQVAFENDLFLNMGQILSIPFVIAGIVLIFHSKKIPEKA